MAAIITETNTLNVTLSDASGNYKTTLKLDNPKDDLAFENIQNAFIDFFAISNSSGKNLLENNGGLPMTKVKEAEYYTSVITRTPIYE